MENLPAYTVNKVQVYRKTPESAYLFREDSVARTTDPLVMDVKLKREYAQGWITNYEAAGGAETGRSGKGLYMGRLFAMRYTDYSNLALWGNVNNISDQSTANGGSRGEWRKPMRPGTGELTLQTGGIDWSLKWRKTGAQVNSAFIGTHVTTDQRSERSSQTFLETGDVYTRSRSTARNERSSFNWKSGFSYPGKRAYVSVHNLAADYTRANNRSLSQSASFSANPVEAYRCASLDSLFGRIGSERLLETLVNRRQQSDLGQYDDFHVYGNGQVSFREPFRGKSSCFLFGGDYHRKDEEKFQQDAVYYGKQPDAAEGYPQDRYFKLPASDYKFGASLQTTLLRHDAPVARIVISFRHNLSYGFDLSHKSGERSLYRLDRLDDWKTPGTGVEHWSDFEKLLSAVGDERQRVIDWANTYVTTESEQKHKMEWASQITIRKKKTSTYYTEINLTLPLDFTRNRIDDYRDLTPRGRTRRDLLFSPRLDITIRKDWRISYRSDESLPNLLYLLDVRDDSDPMSVSLGNAQLKNSREHSLNATFRRTTTAYQRNYSVRASYERYKNRVSMAQWYDRETGRSLFQPRNITGDWNSSLSGNFGQRIDKDGRLLFDASASFNYGNSVDYIFDERTVEDGKLATARSYLRGGLNLTYRFDKRTRLYGKADAGWSRITSDRVHFRSVNTADFSYGLSFTTEFPGKLDFDTDITMYSRRGYMDASMNDNVLMWNVSLSRVLGKGKHWIIKGTGVDLLRQVSNVRSYITGTGRVETWYNTQPAYAMLHLTYRLFVKPRKQQD